MRTMMRRGVIYGLSVLGFALLLVVLTGIGIEQNWGIFRQPAKENFTEYAPLNEFALEAGVVDLAAFDLFMTILPPSSSEEVRQVTFQVDQIVFYVRDDDDSVTVTEICLDQVFLALNPQSQDTASYAMTRAPYCAPVTDNDYVDEYDFGAYALDRFYWVEARLAEPLKIEVDESEVVGLNFWYPYDNFKIEMLMQTFYRVKLDNGEEISGSMLPYVEWNIQTSGTRMWDVTLTNTPDLPLDAAVARVMGEDTVYEGFTIVFNRLLLYRVIFPFFMVAMVLLLCFIPLYAERDSLIDAAAALLFGIFGLKGIIGPGGEMGQTIMDIALIGLYVLLAFAVVLFFVRHRLTPPGSDA